MTKLVVPLYSRIPNRGLDPRPVFAGPVWSHEQKGVSESHTHTDLLLTSVTRQTVVFVKTVKDYYEFSLVFQIDNQAPLYRSRPASFLSHLLGHEGPGSVYSYLKKRGWIFGLHSGVGSNNPSVTPFTVGGRLTREGYCELSFSRVD